MREAMAQFEAQGLERKTKQKKANSADTVPTPTPNDIAGPSQATIKFKLNPVMASLAEEIINKCPQTRFTSVYCEAELTAYLGNTANPTTITVSK